jgi:hypothetical protein
MPSSRDIVIGFTATNPTYVSRPGEYVRFSLDLDAPTEALAGLRGKTPLVFRSINGQKEEVPSQVLAWGPAAQEEDAGLHLEMVFQDAFAPRETKSYEVRFDRDSTLSLPTMQIEELGRGNGDRFS